MSIQEEVDHLFRHGHGKIISVLTKALGTSHIQLAEDAVQEAMIEALDQWSYKGVPGNPVGWVYKVARLKAINILNRKKYERAYASEVGRHLETQENAMPDIGDLFSEEEIADDQLRMIFTCCHPSISEDSQVALTLKTLCGFGISEIASAFLTTDSNINKRLVRARKTIKDANVPFEVPKGKELEDRLSTVLETIYLLFNEGYNAYRGDRSIRYDLCEEAIRLAEILTSNPLTARANTYALLALMVLNTSRFASRLNDHGDVVDLERQDRSLWDADLIRQGLSYLEFAAAQNEVSRYHLLATISAQHCTAPTYEATDWQSILSIYDLLTTIDKSPIVLLNRAIVLAKTAHPHAAIAQLNEIADHPAIQSYLPYYTTKAAIHYQNGEPGISVELLTAALKLPIGQDRKSLINSKMEEYSKSL